MKNQKNEDELEVQLDKLRNSTKKLRLYAIITSCIALFINTFAIIFFIFKGEYFKAVNSLILIVIFILLLRFNYNTKY